VNTSLFSTGLVGGVLRLRLGSAQLFASEVRLVTHAGAVLTAGATSFYGGAGLRFKPAIRVTAFAMVDYVAPFQVRKDGPRYGEFAPQLGLGFTWP
jgi:hypothetical protein